MKTFIGSCQSKQEAPVVGKLIFPDRGNPSAVGGACLIVLSAQSPLPEESAPVGAIRLGVPAPSDPHLPFPVLTLPELSAHYHGQIALLDPQQAALFISPDLATVNRYTSAVRGIPSPQTDAPPLRPSLMITSAAQMKRESPHGWWVDLSDSDCRNEEEGHYEQYCDVADRGTGVPITAVIRLFPTPSSEQLRERIRALFRGAVYGTFSLLLQGIFSSADLRYALDEIHRAFCELEGEGRECNGYIPRGVLIDTPLLLNEALSAESLDFLCLDLPELGKNLSGSAEWEKDPRLLTPVAEAIVRFAERYPQLKKTAILPRPLPCAELLSLLSRLEIKESFLPIASYP